RITIRLLLVVYFFVQAEDGIRDRNVTGLQTCALPISGSYSAISLALLLISSSVALPLDARSTKLRFSFSNLLSSIWLWTIFGLRRSFSNFSYTSTGWIIMDSTEDFRSAGGRMTTV